MAVKALKVYKDGKVLKVLKDLVVKAHKDLVFKEHKAHKQHKVQLVLKELKA